MQLLLRPRPVSNNRIVDLDLFLYILIYNCIFLSFFFKNDSNFVSTVFLNIFILLSIYTFFSSSIIVYLN